MNRGEVSSHPARGKTSVRGKTRAWGTYVSEADSQKVKVPPSSVHNECVFFRVRSLFKGAVMSWLCHHDAPLCRSISANEGLFVETISCLAPRCQICKASVEMESVSC